jgi:hypothetical protein
VCKVLINSNLRLGVRWKKVEDNKDVQLNRRTEDITMAKIKNKRRNNAGRNATLM